MGVVAVVVTTLVAAWWFLVQEWRIAGTLGFPLDDGWIHLQFARALAEGRGLAFNPGEASAGTTSPLWTVLVAAPVRAGLDPVIGAKLLGTVLTAAAAIAATLVTRQLTGDPVSGWLAGLAVALSPRMAWSSVSGMEVSLAVTLLLATLMTYLRAGQRFQFWWGVLAALSGTARPELFPLIGVLVVHDYCWRGARSGTSPSHRLRGAAFALTGFVLVFCIYALANWSAGGRVFPTTFAAKSSSQGLAYALAALDGGELLRSLTVRPFENVNLLLRFYFDQSQVLFALLLPGTLAAVGLWRGVAAAEGSGLLLGFVLLDAALMGAMASDVPLYGQEGRYVLPLVTLLFVVSGIGAAAVRQATRRDWVVAAIAAVAIARLSSQAVQYASVHARQVDNINRLHVEMGRWLADKTPAGGVVATNDIGAIGYVSGRRVIDMEGLVTPAIIPYKEGGRHLEYLEQARPDWLVVFPEWYPHLVARTDLFEEVHRITVPRVTAAHDTLVVYRTPWTRDALINRAGPVPAR